MPQDVTYADLRFTQSPPEGTRLEDLTYENVQASSRQDQKGGSKQPAWFAAVGFAGAALVALVLLAALIGLGVHYGRLQKTSEEEKVQLAERLREEEEERVQVVQTELNWTKRELSRTRVNWTESQQQANVALAALEMQNLRREEALNASWARVAKDWCPEDWFLYRGKCLLFFTERKNWAESNKSCEAQSSRLLVTRSWKPGWFQVPPAWRDLPWIGLRRQIEQGSPWTWVDGSVYEGKDLPQRHYQHIGDCVRLTPGKLQHTSCTSLFPYICEKAKGGRERGE